MKDKRKLQLLQRLDFHHLTNDEFEFYVEYCRHARVDPWSRKLGAELWEDPKTGRYRLHIFARARNDPVFVEPGEPPTKARKP